MRNPHLRYFRSDVPLDSPLADLEFTALNDGTVTHVGARVPPDLLRAFSLVAKIGQRTVSQEIRLLMEQRVAAALHDHEER